MAIKDIKGFSDKAKADAELKDKLVACQKVRELLTLAQENGFNFIEDEMYPPRRAAVQRRPAFRKTRQSAVARLSGMDTTNKESREKSRFFVTYTGVKLPFKLVNELQAGEVENRNTFFRGYFDKQDRLTGFDKLAYGEVELMHRYEYHENGKLKRAEITDIDGEVTAISFDSD